jgi:hypothetical protein
MEMKLSLNSAELVHAAKALTSSLFMLLMPSPVLASSSKTNSTNLEPTASIVCSCERTAAASNKRHKRGQLPAMCAVSSVRIGEVPHPPSKYQSGSS